MSCIGTLSSAPCKMLYKWPYMHAKPANMKGGRRTQRCAGTHIQVLLDVLFRHVPLCIECATMLLISVQLEKAHTQSMLLQRISRNVTTANCLLPSHCTHCLLDDGIATCNGSAAAPVSR